MKPVINRTLSEEWKNWHKSLTVGGRVALMLQPTNQFEESDSVPGKEFLAGLRGLEEIINEARSEGRKIRAFGSRWSLSNVAFTNEYLVDCGQLDFVKIGMPKNQIVDSYRSRAHRLVFAQSGLMVRSLNEHLHSQRLSLPTSGASDGQRIAGAISTGTHGSSHEVGSMTEFVKGIHVVILDKHVFIQRASDKVVNAEFSSWLDHTEIIDDDELFNAALVNFGAFGLIHALVLEVEPEYNLRRFIGRYDVSQVRNAITDWNFSGLELPKGNEMPFHFECAINPYRLSDGENGAYVRVYYKEASLESAEVDSIPISDTPDIHTSMGFHSSAEELKLHGLHAEEDESNRVGIIGKFVELGLNRSFPTKEPEHPIRIPSKWFTGKHSAKPQTNAPVAGTSIEIGVPFNRVGDAMDLVLNTLGQHPFAAPLAFRYVKKSSATLGFTGLSDIVVTMELPGPWGAFVFPKTGLAHKELFRSLKYSDIPHSFHWGQQFPKNAGWVINTYGYEAVSQWKAKRTQLLGDEGVRMFDNEIMSIIGLSQDFV